MEITNQDGWNEHSCVITNDDIDKFAEVTGDRNSIHFGDNRIAHGALIVGKLSAAIWRKFGDGTIALGIESKIQRPVKPGEEFFIALSPGKEIGDCFGTTIVEFNIYKSCGGRQKSILSGSVKIVCAEAKLLAESTAAVA